MKVIEKKTQVFEVRIGDLFRDAYEGDYYFLAKTSSNSYDVISLTGTDTWNSNDSFDVIKEDITKAINEDRLIHYPKAIYQLMIDKI